MGCSSQDENGGNVTPTSGTWASAGFQRYDSNNRAEKVFDARTSNETRSINSTFKIWKRIN